MKLKQLSICIVLLSLLVSIVAGCQLQFQPGTYTDDMGRAVAIDQIPQRLVSFGPNITEILFALGLGEKVVGVTDFCDYPEAAKLKPKVGDAFNPSLERIVGLEPDLVFTVKQEQLNGELDALGIRFMVLEPEDIDGIFKGIINCPRYFKEISWALLISLRRTGPLPKRRASSSIILVLYLPLVDSFIMISFYQNYSFNKNYIEFYY